MKVSLASRFYRKVVMTPGIQRARVLYRNGYDAVLQATERFTRNTRSSGLVSCKNIVDHNGLVKFLEERARSILSTLKDRGDSDCKHREAGLQKALADLKRLLKSGPLFSKEGARKWIRKEVHIEQFQAAFYNWYSHQKIKKHKLRCFARRYALRECAPFGCFSPLLSRVFS